MLRRTPPSEALRRFAFHLENAPGRDSRQFGALRAFEKARLFSVPPNFSKAFFGLIVEFQDVGGEKIWKRVFLIFTPCWFVKMSGSGPSIRPGMLTQAALFPKKLSLFVIRPVGAGECSAFALGRRRAGARTDGGRAKRGRLERRGCDASDDARSWRLADALADPSHAVVGEFGNGDRRPDVARLVRDFGLDQMADRARQAERLPYRGIHREFVQHGVAAAKRERREVRRKTAPDSPIFACRSKPARTPRSARWRIP